MRDYSGAAVPWNTPSNEILSEALTNGNNVWSDICGNSPPILTGPFILTVFMQHPWNHLSFDDNSGFIEDIDIGACTQQVTYQAPLIANHYNATPLSLAVPPPSGPFQRGIYFDFSSLVGY